jgi:hypothetical protein
VHQAKLDAVIQQRRQQQADLEYDMRQCGKMCADCDQLDPSDDRFRSSPQLQKLHVQGARDASLHGSSPQAGRQPVLFPTAVQELPDLHRAAGASLQQQQQKRQLQEQQQEHQEPSNRSALSEQQQQQQEAGEMFSDLHGELLQGLGSKAAAREPAADDDMSAGELLDPYCDI